MVRVGVRDWKVHRERVGSCAVCCISLGVTERKLVACMKLPIDFGVALVVAREIGAWPHEVALDSERIV